MYSLIVSSGILGGFVHRLSVSVLDLALPAITGLMIWILTLSVGSIKSWIIRALAIRLVRYAFEKIPSKSERYDFVAKKLAEKFSFLAEEEIETYIEEAVVNLKAGLGAAYDKKK